MRFLPKCSELEPTGKTDAPSLKAGEGSGMMTQPSATVTSVYGQDKSRRAGARGSGRIYVLSLTYLGGQERPL